MWYWIIEICVSLNYQIKSIWVYLHNIKINKVIKWQKLTFSHFIQFNAITSLSQKASTEGTNLKYVHYFNMSTLPYSTNQATSNNDYTFSVIVHLRTLKNNSPTSVATSRISTWKISGSIIYIPVIWNKSDVCMQGYGKYSVTLGISWCLLLPICRIICYLFILN